MPYIQDWRVAYSPRNPHLDILVKEVSTALALKEHIAADNPVQLAEILVTQKLVCGIEFEHDAVIVAYYRIKHI